MELSTLHKGKMEAKMEESRPELYYIAKFRVRKYRKGIVCGKVATVLELLNLRPLPSKPSLDIFLALLSFFRPFRYGKNDLSRSPGILFPGAPIVSMVVYVVVKIRSQIDGFGLMGADRFISRICGQLLWSFYHRITPSGLSYCNSSSAICQEVQQLKFAPQ